MKINYRMKINYKTCWTLIGGIALGAAMVHGLHAQAKPPTYVVVAIRKINDAETFKTGVVDKAKPELLAAAGGKYVIRTQDIKPLDGTPPQRFILLAFDSSEKALAWHNSAATIDLDSARIKSTDSVSFMVDGM